MANLTPKQQRFVEEYLIDLNATQAAIRAGYSEKTADSIGLQLLRKTQVSEQLRACRWTQFCAVILLVNVSFADCFKRE